MRRKRKESKKRRRSEQGRKDHVEDRQMRKRKSRGVTHRGSKDRVRLTFTYIDFK